jgi:hypothetical protein
MVLSFVAAHRTFSLGFGAQSEDMYLTGEARIVTQGLISSQGHSGNLHFHRHRVPCQRYRSGLMSWTQLLGT